MVTKEEILRLEAGRNADNLISEHVMQWPMIRYRHRMVVDVSRFSEADKLKWLACTSRQSPEFSTDLNACHEMEAELQKRGLAADYARKFAWVTSDSGDFHLIHTDALTKCKAALLAVTGVN